MKIEKQDNTIKLWLSAEDTYRWANKPGATWPCSVLSGKTLFAKFSNGDLVDHTIDSKDGVDVPGDEFDAITSDFLTWTCPRCAHQNAGTNEICMGAEMGDGRCGHERVR